MSNNFLKLILIIFVYSNATLGDEAHFDLSDPEIEIQTNFNGKEVIIFGLTEPQFDTIITIKGPNKDTQIRKKERFFGFWFNVKKIIYKDLPNIFFIATSAPISSILNEDTIIREKLYFDQMITNIITQRNFVDQNEFKVWNKNLIKIKKNSNLYKEYDLKIIDNRLFQTKIFFPSTTIPGPYNVNIYQVKNKVIVSEKNKKIIIKRAGLGEKIFRFAHEQPGIYGVISIIFAIFAGLVAATAFRRL